MKHDEDLLKVASQMRTDIMRELHIYYAKKGTPDYANRLGSLFCLIMNCEVNTAKLIWLFDLFRIVLHFSPRISSFSDFLDFGRARSDWNKDSDYPNKIDCYELI